MNEFNNMKRACEQGDLETIIYMCHCNNEYNIGINLLHIAFEYGKLDVSVYLNLNGAIPNTYLMCWVAMCWVATGGHLPIARWFMDSVYFNAEMGRLMFINASYYGHLQVVKYLAEELHIDIHVSDDSALANASYRGYLPVVKYLVEHGANVYAGNSRALRVAVQREHHEVVDYLVKQRTCGQNILEWFKSWIHQ